MTYQIKSFLKFAEEDKYNEGCNPDTTQCFEVNATLTAETIPALIRAAMDFLGIDGTPADNCQLYEDEPDRIDFCKMENAEGYTPSKIEMQQWKKNKCRLWYVVYTAYIEQTAPVILTDEILKG